jgi:glycosyltransferase involved in cell wall biosynthesis
MVPVSVVIITYNEVSNISKCIRRAQLITDDIIVVDSGSTDSTMKVARELGAKVFELPWDGYGFNKNKGIGSAKYDWIFSFDADEIPDDELIAFLHTIDYTDTLSVYDFNFKVYFGRKLIRYGSWGNNHQIRLFSRLYGRWSHLRVHETLLFSESVKVRRALGNVHHHSVHTRSEYQIKVDKYARLSALKYYEARQDATFIKLYLSPAFNLMWNYLLRFGFLDGKEGWIIARATAWYTWRKYAYLDAMNAAEKKHSLSRLS